ncbi:hypothetical protein ACS0TY_035659 [Phlomoides rotata]
MSSTNLNSNHDLGELGAKDVKLEQDFAGTVLQQNENPKLDLVSREESDSLIRRNRMLNAPNSGANVLDQEQLQIDDSRFCSTSSISPAPICRQFWKAGNYDDRLNPKPIFQNGTSYLRIHPKFLHSNATSHKWAFGAVAELLDNSVDEIQNGATFVSIDKTLNSRNGTPALLIQDNGGGMGPEAMRGCLSFGFSDKNSKIAIGQYGNGFKTSTMRLGADVVVFTRSIRDRKLTQSVGLLSYSFLMQTGQDRIVVPMVDYQFDSHTGSWNTLHNEEHLNNNLSILLQWSPVTTEAELLKHCDDIGPHGTKIIVYNLWHDDDGKMELDFESDPEDILLSEKDKSTRKVSSRMDVYEKHLANRLKYSLRAYLSILYLRPAENFGIYLRGRLVEYRNIANDLKFPEFILYRPLNVESSVITTIGFLKEAPAVNIHGFNVYHKNRLILPFWHVVTYCDSRGRGVVGVLEANFIEPTHNKQEFERTPVFQKLETRLKLMTQEYWDYHCGFIGYQVKKKPQPNMEHHAASVSGAIGAKTFLAAGASQHVPTNYHRNSQGATFKRKRHDHAVESERVKRMGGMRSRPIDIAEDVKHAVDPLDAQEAASIIQENRGLRAQCEEYEKMDKELNLKITRLRAEVQEAQREYARLRLDSRVLERVKMENREARHV